MSFSTDQIKSAFTTTTTSSYVPLNLSTKYDNTIRLSYAGDTIKVNSN